MPQTDRWLSTTKRHLGPTCSHLPSSGAQGDGCYRDRPVIAGRPRSSLRLPGKPDSSSQKCGVSSLLSFRLLLHLKNGEVASGRGITGCRPCSIGALAIWVCTEAQTQSKKLRDLGFKLSLWLEAVQITTFLPLPRIIFCFYHFSSRNSQCQSPQPLVDLVQPLSF